MATFDSTVIQRVANGLYNTQVGNATMTEALNAINGDSYGSVEALANALYVRDFGGMTDAEVAAILVANVGITGTALVGEAVSVVTNALAGSADDAKGATVISLLNAFSHLTSNADFGGFATAYNAQVSAGVAYAQDGGTPDVHLTPDFLNQDMVFRLLAEDAAGAQVMHLTGDQDVRIDFTNPANQITGRDLDGDGTIEFNGSERSIRGEAANFEIVDAYPRNPLDHTDSVNNFLGDIYFDGTGYGGDGVSTDGNIFLGGLGHDIAFGGIGNDFLAGGGIAQGHGGTDDLRGGRNADFFFAEFSGIDITDGSPTLYVDGGNTSDDQPAGTAQSDQDNDWLLFEASDDDEPVQVGLEEDGGSFIPGAGDFDEDVVSRNGEFMDLADVENFDASGNLYGFLDDMTDGAGNQLRIGDRARDFRYEDGANAGAVNYGLGSSAQLDIDGSEVGNIIVAGYDNDFVAGNGGNDLLFGGNLQFLYETVDGGVTNLNLAGITLDGRDDLIGGDGSDGIVYEADKGVIAGEGGTDTLWVTNYALGTTAIASAITAGADGRQALRLDLGSQTATGPAEADVGFLGYGGSDTAGTADQTVFASSAATKAVTVTGMETIDASGLSTGVRGLDYFSAGTNSPDLNFSNRQNFSGYEGDLDLRGMLDEDNNLYAGPGNDVIEGRGGSDGAVETTTAYDLTLQGGDGNDDFYFSIDGDTGGDETNIIRRKVDANNDGFWDGSDAKGTVGTWGGDFGQNTSVLGGSVLTIAFTEAGVRVPLSTAIVFVSEVVTGVQNVDGTFTEITFNSAAIRAATTYQELADAINAEIADEFADEVGNIVATVDNNSVQISDAQGRTLADTITQVPGAGVIVNQGANSQSGNVFVFGEPEETITQDRLIFKSYEDRSDNEGVDDDSVTGSTISLGTDAYAEDLVVDFAADGTRIAEDQEYVITFKNLTTEDTVTVNVNGVTYKLQVGIALNNTQEDAEDGVGDTQVEVQTAFLARLADYINSFMDDDTAAGQVAAASDATTLTLTQVAYHDGEETVFMTAPVVTVTNESGGERPTAAVDNDAQTEVFLFQFDGRDNKLNFENVLFWGQESVNRATLETALTAGDTIVGSEALVIDGGSGAGDDDLRDIVHNLATDDELNENFAVHGDDYLIGGAGDDTISGMTGDDRVRGSLGNDALDGGKDWYQVRRDGDRDYTVEYLNAFEAAELDTDGDVLDIQLIEQTEDGVDMIGGDEFVAYFDDTLIYQQRDFTAGVTRFTITLDNYSGDGEEIVFDEGGAGTVGVDANGDGLIEPENVSTFTEFENIRTVSGTGLAVAGTNGGQGRDTLNVQALSDDADVGVKYDMTGDDATGGDVSLLEDLDDDEDTAPTERLIMKVDGVENVIFGDGDDVLLIDETEAAKDNDITGDDGDDLVVYMNDFGDPDDEPTVTINVGNAHVAGSSGSLDLVVMTEGRVGSVVATDTLRGIEEITLDGDTAGGEREDDAINVENLSAGASVNYITGEVFSDTDGDLDFADGVLQLTINNIEEMEFVIADGADGVVVADSDIMDNNSRTDGEDDNVDLTIDSFLNYDMLDERGDTPERLTISELRAIPGGTADTADRDDIPEGYNFAQFNFELGQGTDTVDYSQTTDAINAIVDVTLADDTQYVMIDSDGGDFDGVDGSESDRVDRLVEVERVVASQAESVLDFTASDMDIEITFQYQIANNVVLNADDGYSVTNTVRIADGNGDQIAGLTQFVERYTAEDGDITNSTWNRVEGSDNAEAVIYDGSENLVDQNAVDHRFSDDTLNLRGGDNSVSYNPLETSISAFITINEYDPTDPLADQITVSVDFLNGNGTDEIVDGLPGAGQHTITSHAADNEIAAGTLKLEASQDAEDVVEFGGDTSNLFILGQSPGVLTVSVGDSDTGAMVLTGFEFLRDNGGSDDVFDFQDLDNIFGDLTLLDGTGDRDTVKVSDLVLEFWSNAEINDYYDDNGGSVDENTVVSLEMINDYFAFDFDILDVSSMTENNLVIFGDDDDQDDDGILNAADTDYDDPSASGLNDVDGDGTADNARDIANDALVVGDLGLIDSLGFEAEDDANFDAIWFTEASLGDGDSFVLDTTDVDFVLEDDANNEIFTIYGAMTGQDLNELNFSRVTSDVTVAIDGDAAMTIVGGSGDDILTGSGGNDTIEGGVGADDLDGSAVAPIGATYTVTISGVLADSGAAGDTMTIAGMTLTTSAAPTLATEIAAGADADQIGSKFASQTLASWITALDADGLSLAEASSLVSVSYDLTSNELTFAFSNGAAGSTLLGAASVIDLTTAPAVTGAAVLGATEVDTDFTPQADSADNYVYDEGDSTETAMDQIFNFTVDNGGGVDDTIDLTAYADLEGHNFGLIVNGGSGFANFAAVKAAAADSFETDESPFIGSDGTDTWVFIDDDHSSSLDAGETVIKLVGIDATGIDLDNFVQP